VLQRLLPARWNRAAVEAALLQLRAELASGIAGWMPGEDPTH